jgi:hypothetical protein
MDGSRFASRDGGKFSGALPAHSPIESILMQFHLARDH